MASIMKMLYGPPGTGKTWLAAREAVKAVEPQAYAHALTVVDPEAELQALHKSLVNEGRVLWVTFHPNYSYEDFIEGYRPVVRGGQMAYEVVDGPFKVLCERVRKKRDLEVGDRVDSASGREPFEVVDVEAGGWILRVRPNRKDEVAEFLDKYVPRRDIEHLLDAGFQPDIFSIAGAGTYELAQYGLNPNDVDIPSPEQDETITTRKGPVIRKVIAARTGILSSSDLSNSSHYGAVMRRLKDIRTGSSPSKPVALVIDEFNRADPSRVFGELLTLLEVDKREGMPEERKVWLPYSRMPFTVPPTLSIIGTMNTVDKSLAPVDFAMRRRFRFQYVSASPELLPTEYAGINLSELLRRLNSRLGALLGSGHEVGHAFFLRAKLEEIVGQRGWDPLTDGRLRSLAYVFRTNIMPTIAEYFHDDWRKVKAVAGATVVAGQQETLLEEPLVDEIFIERLPEEYELVDGRVAHYSDWWNPESTNWDAGRFMGFLAALSAGQ